MELNYQRDDQPVMQTAGRLLEEGRAALSSPDESPALGLFLQATELLDGERDSTMKADVLNDLALAYYRPGALDEAIETFACSRAVAVAINDPVRTSMAEHNLGLMQLRRSSWADALQHFEAALSTLSARKHALNGPTLHRSGVAHDRLGLLDEADARYREAIAELATGDHAREHSEALADLARLQRRTGRHGEAYANFVKAVAVLEDDPIARPAPRTIALAAVQALRVGRPLGALRMTVRLLGHIRRRARRS